MTAEVAILNKQCVAMASDSAVTTGEAKIFNTVNKLFGLSKRQPVGIMVYSSAEVMGVPVETVIKEFRRLEGDKDQEHLADYAHKFHDFLALDDKTLFNEDARLLCLQRVVCHFFHLLQSRTRARLSRQSYSWGHPTKKEAIDALQYILGELEHQCINSPLLIDPIKKTQCKKIFSGAVDSEIDRCIAFLRNSIPITQTLAKRIRIAVIEQFFHEWSCGGSTGFVIAGFGNADVFPRLCSFEFTYSALGIQKIKSGEGVEISREYPAAIAPFAQQDVMQAFILGKDPFYDRVISESVGAFFAEKARLIGSSTSQSRKEAAAMKALGAEVRNELMQKLSDVTDKRFISPLLDTVSSMPKEEIAVLAESLISLTSLKRKASREAETVGGPTDVAVISKGDGFIWVKRKQYFDPKLNPHFAVNYVK